MKLKRKFSLPNMFVGTVNGQSLEAPGRTKREATKRLRKMFNRQGIATSTALLDHLLVSAVNQPAQPVPRPKVAKTKTVKASNIKQPKVSYEIQYIDD